MIRVISLAAMLLLAGCADSTVPLALLQGGNLETISKGSTSKAELVVEASVAKEIAVMQTLQNRDKQIAKAAQNAGMRMDYKMVTETIQLPGMDKPIILTRQLPVVSYQPMPEFNQQLPTEPSRHPVWQSIDNVVSTIGHAGLIGYGIHETAGVIKSLGDSAGSRTTINSGGGNVTGGNVNSQKVTQSAGRDLHAVSDNKPCQGERCGGESTPALDNRGSGKCSDTATFADGVWWISPGCSCDSFSKGRCAP